MSQVEPIYTLETAADRLGVRPETVREWIESRGLRAVPLGHSTQYKPRGYLIREAWLIEWLDAHSRVGIEESAQPVVSRRIQDRPHRPARANDDLIGPRPI